MAADVPIGPNVRSEGGEAHAGGSHLMQPPRIRSLIARVVVYPIDVSLSKGLGRARRGLGCAYLGSAYLVLVGARGNMQFWMAERCDGALRRAFRPTELKKPNLVPALCCARNSTFRRQRVAGKGEATRR